MPPPVRGKIGSADEHLKLKRLDILASLFSCYAQKALLLSDSSSRIFLHPSGRIGYANFEAIGDSNHSPPFLSTACCKYVPMMLFSQLLINY